VGATDIEVNCASRRFEKTANKKTAKKKEKGRLVSQAAFPVLRQPHI
jgi:hypothetical protein